ncbi:MAG: ATP-dependent Clp protease proteolytic subunit, partial [Candidatus Niyogibacteria bacterium]|nr:ATP-dependent Clp protease proteolytic subunit [Candidatus Niyogibacteria bacterium]
AASGAAILLAAGEKGKRFALPNAEIMIHQVLGAAEGQATEIEISAKHILRIKEKLNKILADETRQAVATIERDTDRDFYMDADEAKKYGILDKIIRSKETK